MSALRHKRTFTSALLRDMDLLWTEELPARRHTPGGASPCRPSGRETAEIYFQNSLACAILGEQPDEIAAAQNLEPNSAIFRTYMATRSRIGEDWLSAAYNRGVRQAAILGAGFDTFGLRNLHPDLIVFEVDHPATQSWKRERIGEARLPVPETLKFAPVDFTTDQLIPSLVQSGFDVKRPTFFLWLGVVPYLSQDDVFATLRFIAELPGAEVVFDYSEPVENYPEHIRPFILASAQKVAALGEPWLSYFDPADLAEMLRGLGFQEIEDLDRNAVTSWISKAETVGKAAGPHLIQARRLA